MQITISSCFVFGVGSIHTHTHTQTEKKNCIICVCIETQSHITLTWYVFRHEHINKHYSLSLSIFRPYLHGIPSAHNLPYIFFIEVPCCCDYKNVSNNRDTHTHNEQMNKNTTLFLSRARVYISHWLIKIYISAYVCRKFFG